MTNFKTMAVTSTALCALLAACASKPLYATDQTPAPPVAQPPAAPPPPPPAATPGEEPGPPAMPTARIESNKLAPVPGSAVAPPPPGRPPAKAYAYAAPRESAPPRMIAQKAPGSGPVKTDAPEPVKVKKGDTLIAISHRTGVNVRDLADLNGLEKPYRLRPGTSIKLPSKRYYTVQSGDTLFSVARRFGMAPKDLADFNDTGASKALHRGQKIYLPADAKDKGAPKPIMVAVPRAAEPRLPTPRPEPREAQAAPPPYTPPYSPPPPVSQSAPAIAQAAPPRTAAERPAEVMQPRQPVPPAQTIAPRQQAQPAPPAAIAAVPPRTAQSAPAAATPAVTAGDSDVAAAGRGVFLWPVRGDLISTFGQKGAVHNDGIDVGATQGDSVRAAAAGEVVYAGNVVQGFGNLVLIKHAGGWVTAYAHLASIEVKMRQQVTQGQEIGLVGETGGVDRPQLHFEIRYAPTPSDKARPVDPMLVLPVQ